MKLGYTLLYVPDVAAALAFYESAFGLPRRFLHDSGGYGELDTGTTALGFVAVELARGNGVAFDAVRLDRVPPGIEIAFVTEDVPAAYAKAVATGAVAVVGPAQKPWGQTIAYVRDNNGFLVELCSPM